ncbi:hypothetical protein A4X17_14915 [Plantibacter sp. H53]|uniref:DUF2254 domain-containing protein n=1 Tax=Plantibacter sp. H53 TaxID=1827323 RepID=UPI0007DA372A|nr:DUF2254 domain-containing protein [Plantibacter sp. H53]OAN33728.1 hypothetical protein A4X17_14915 [Plantibacter sp. H53]
MKTGLSRFLFLLGKKVWARAAVFTVMAVAFALAAGFIGGLLPFRLVIDLGQDSVGSILQIIASSMLAVTTFSITAMVTVYSSATTIATPRATQLMVEDTTSQNALSTFVGGFTFSLVGIIALSTGYYGDQGRTILFFGTLVMITIVVVTLLRWIAHLSTFGRMSDIIDRVEAAATTSLSAYAESPSLGANPLAGPDRQGTPVFADKPGYVVFVDLRTLNQAAANADVSVQVVATAGRVADATTPLAIVVGEAETALQASIRQAFRIAAHRTYEQDPRLGVIALAEIGSRALSPATNDPGTAIEIIGALQRVFTATLTTTRDGEVDHPQVWVRGVTLEDLVMDAFRPLSRDGAGILEVQMRLQKCFAALAATAPDHADTFRSAATLALQRSSTELDEADLAVLDALHRRLNA